MSVRVRQRGKKWWVFIAHKGRRKAKCVGDKRTAQLVAEKIRAKLVLGEFKLDEGKRRPFDTYYPAWVDSYAKANCKASTYHEYKLAYRIHLLPAFGNKDIGDISRDDVKQLVYGMFAKGLKRGTVKATISPLREMFYHAVEDGHVGSNPVARIFKRCRVDAPAARPALFLTREELSHVLAVCREHFPRWYPFVLFLARTGARVGEVMGLQWSDIDLRRRFAEIRRSLSRGEVTTPKSGKIRRVDLSRHLVDTLRDLDLHRKQEKLKRGWLEMSPWLFLNEAGKPIDINNFRHRVWGPLFAKAGLRQPRIHDLRHSYASLLIEQGESLAYIRDQMGHHSIMVTVDVYGHLVTGGNREAVDRLDDPTPPISRSDPAAR